MGIGTVTLPWAYQQSGILLGVFITGLTCGLTYCTQLLLLRTAGGEIDYATVAYKHFNGAGWVFA